jgi:MIP family channel proteins
MVGRMAASGGLYSSATGGKISRPAVAELVGTFVLVFVGCSVAVAAALERPVAGPPYNSLAIALAFGLALVAVVAAIGHISGGHVNPAVTVGQAAVGLFPWRNVPVYLIAQLLGAIAAAFAVWLCFGDAARDQANLGATALAENVSVMRGLLTEALITFVLVFVVGLVAGDPRVPSARIASIAVGFALACGVFVGGPLTGGGVNPARALGPMIVSGQLDDFWLYIVGPLVGGVLAATVALYVLRAFQIEQDDDGDDEKRGPSRIGASTRAPDGRAHPTRAR